MFACTIASDKAYGFDGRVITNGIYGWNSAVDDIQNTRRKA
jgi:hypothetical protein